MAVGEGLLAHTTMLAVFKAGHTAVGHHWRLFDAQKTQIGHTQRVHSGGALKRAMWKSVSATGMDKGNDIRVDVLDSSGGYPGEKVVQLFSRNEKEAWRVEVSGADDAPLGVVRRERDVGFTFEDASGTVLGRLPVDPDNEPWELQDADGNVFGSLAREPAKLEKAATLIDLAMGWDDFAGSKREFQNTMHLGFAFSNTYAVTLTDPPGSEPLRTFAVLMPAIAGVAY